MITRGDRLWAVTDNKYLTTKLNVKSKFVNFNPYEKTNVDSIVKKPFSFDKNKIYFEKMDTISAALKYGQSDFLVFASPSGYGGGFFKGQHAQEEDIFYSTDLFTSSEEMQKKYYPLKGILTMDCHIIRDSELKELSNAQDARAIFAAAPISSHIINLNNDEDFYNRMCALTDAVSENHKGDYFIVGAWGCGVFNNDPKKVAEMFKDVLYLFQNNYKGGIVFAIPNDEMLNIFKEVMG